MVKKGQQVQVPAYLEEKLNFINESKIMQQSKLAAEQVEAAEVAAERLLREKDSNQQLVQPDKNDDLKQAAPSAQTKSALSRNMKLPGQAGQRPPLPLPRISGLQMQQLGQSSGKNSTWTTSRIHSSSR